MLFSLGRLWRQPVASLMTITVIGIALVLPAGLFVLSENMSSLSNRWDSASQITLFLQQDVTPPQAQKLSTEIASWSTIEQVHYQSAQQSLDEFRQLSGLGDLLDSLPNNPLPAIIIVEPTDEKATLSGLVSRLNDLPQVDQAKLDMEWLQRFRSINKMVQRGVSILAILLALSVVLAIGNTIRLAILSREAEIRVMKLVGATDRFIRRPFLYTGFWYGFLGGLFAWITLIFSMGLLSGPVNELAGHYGSDFSLHWFGGFMFLILPIAGATLGILGAWLAVGRHLHQIEPS
ncbi:MAG: cell division protein [Methylophaga sp.]|nr:cell division protein [Methylophaga sp.]